MQTVVVLHQDPQARPARRHARLYHYALLYPSREELARAALRLAVAPDRIQGMSDHGTHEAIYLPDREGNGIELAADRPRDQWPDLREEFARGRPCPLDVASLLATVAGDEPPPHVADGLCVGHVHLHAGDVDRGLTFYRDLLGFEEQLNLGTRATDAPAARSSANGVWATRLCVPLVTLGTCENRLARTAG